MRSYYCNCELLSTAATVFCIVKAAPSCGAERLLDVEVELRIFRVSTRSTSETALVQVVEAAA
jgi:hypothetical protein